MFGALVKTQRERAQRDTTKKSAALPEIFDDLSLLLLEVKINETISSRRGGSKINQFWQLFFIS